MVRLFPLAALLCLLPAIAGAAASVDSPAMPVRVEGASLEDRLASQYRFSGLSFSPDGRRAVFVLRSVEGDRNIRNRIWLYDVASKTTRQLTNGDRDGSPVWSPDGRYIAFLSSRARDGAQIHVLDMTGGEALPLTRGVKGVAQLQWLGRDHLAFVATQFDPAIPAPDGGDSPTLGSESFAQNALYRLNVSSRAISRVSKPGWAVGQYAATPDGQLLVATATDAFAPEQVIQDLFVIHAANGAMRAIGKIDSVEYSGLKVSPDGRRLAYLASTLGPTPFDLFVRPLSGGEARNLTGAAAVMPVDLLMTDFVWRDASTILALAKNGFADRLYSVSLAGRAAIRQEFDKSVVTAFTAHGDRILFSRTDSLTPAELFASEAGRPPQAITQLHKDFPALQAPEIIHYPAADGLMIEAALFRPHRAKTMGPAVMLIHGGPTDRWGHQVNTWAQALVARGYVVLAPNIRGSAGYSQAFLTSNRADWGGKDFGDVLAGADYLVREKLADPDRLGIAGWSYGGYMSAWAVTQTTRFKAAVSGAPMLDLNVQFGAGLAEVTPYDTWYIGNPWKNPENFRRLAPLTHVANVATPTLLLVGDNDPVDPTVQNWQFYRALRMNNVKTELVLYPGEGHSISQKRHVIDVMKRVGNWMDEYLK